MMEILFRHLFRIKKFKGPAEKSENLRISPIKSMNMDRGAARESPLWS